MNSRLDCTWVAPISVPPPNAPAVLNSLQAADRAECKKVQTHMSRQACEPGEENSDGYGDPKSANATKLRIPLFENRTGCSRRSGREGTRDSWKYPTGATRSPCTTSESRWS